MRGRMNGRALTRQRDAAQADGMAKTKNKAAPRAKPKVVRFTLSNEAIMLLTELAGPNAECVIKAMAPAYSGNPEFNKFKVG
jgi:hypothetical protein